MSFFVGNKNSDVKVKSSSVFGSLKYKKPKSETYYEKRKDDVENLKDFHDSLNNEKKDNINTSDDVKAVEQIDQSLPSDIKNLKQQEPFDSHNSSKHAPKWRSSGVIGTNLIKDEVVTYVDWKRNLIILFAAIIIFSVLAYASFYFVRAEDKKTKSASTELDSEILKLNTDLNMAKKNVEEADLFRRRMSTVSHYLDNHIYWTKFFENIENYVLPNVSFGETLSFSGSIDSAYTLSTKTNSFNDIINQLRVFRKGEYIESATAYSGKVELQVTDKEVKSLVSTSIDLKIKKDIFYKNDSEFLNYESE